MTRKKLRNYQLLRADGTQPQKENLKGHRRSQQFFQWDRGVRNGIRGLKSNVDHKYVYAFFLRKSNLSPVRSEGNVPYSYKDIKWLKIYDWAITILNHALQSICYPFSHKYDRTEDEFLVKFRSHTTSFRLIQQAKQTVLYCSRTTTVRRWLNKNLLRLIDRLIDWQLTGCHVVNVVVSTVAFTRMSAHDAIRSIVQKDA
jgi:hypothetical protein